MSKFDSMNIIEKLKLFITADIQNQLISSVVILALFIVLNRITRIITNKLARRDKIKDNEILQTTIQAFGKSLAFFFVVLAFIIAFKIIDFAAETAPVIEDIIGILSTISVAFFIYQLVDIPAVWFEQMLQKDAVSTSNKMFLPVLRRTLQVIVIALGLLQIVQIISDKPLTSIIAGLGIGGLALALAAQDSLKHLLGSFVLAGDKPFEIGDRVNIDGHDGPIESIGLRSTRIRTLEGHLVTVPNGELANKTIQNIGKRPHIRRLLNLSLTYDTSPAKIKEAKEIVLEILKDHEGMHPDFPPYVYFNDFKADYLNLFVIYWYHPPAYWDYMAFSEKVNLQIIERFNAAGIEFAFPTQTIHVKQ
jgi:MscS family membrane protein